MSHAQHTLFDEIDAEKSAPLMQAMDKINRKYGRFVVAPAAMGLQTRWATKFEKKSPSYTTKYAELPLAKA